MEHIQKTTTLQPDDFPTLFKMYIERSVQAALARVNAGDSILSDEVRERALHVLSYAFKLPEAWSHTRALLFALIPKMEQGGPNGDWMDCLTQSERYSHVCGDNQAAAEFQWQLGYFYRQQSRFDLAGQWLQASASGFASLGKAHDQARAFNELAFIACLQHHYHEAEQLIEAALYMLDEADPERTMSYRVLGIMAYDRESWQEAEEYHRKALYFSEKQGDKLRTAWCLQNLANALRNQKRFSEAIAYYERALAILLEINNVYYQAIVQMNIGHTYRMNERIHEALQSHRLALEAFRRVGDKLNLAHIYTQLGLDYWALHQWIQSEQAFLISVNLYTILGDESWRLNAIDGLAMTYLSQKFYAKTIAVLEPAIAALPRIAGMPNYDYLHRSLTKHLNEAREGLATVGKPI